MSHRQNDANHAAAPIVPSRRDILINGQQYFVMATGGANLPPELIALRMA